MMNYPPAPSSNQEGLVDVQAVRFVQSLPLDLSVEDVMIRLQQEELSLPLEQVQIIRGRERARERARARTLNGSEESAEETMSQETSGVQDNVNSVDEAKQEESAETRSELPRRGRKPGGTDTKAGFVRSLPLDLPTKEVLERAKQHGLEMSEGYVYAIRGKLKQPVRSTAAVSRPGARSASTQPTIEARKGAQHHVEEALHEESVDREKATSSGFHLFRRPENVSVHKVEFEFARLVLEIGVIRAEQLVSQLKDKLAAFVLPAGVGAEVVDNLRGQDDESASETEELE